MKKLLSIIGLGLLTLSALAQNHQAQDFLNFRLIVITNTIGITNLSNPNTVGTNLAFTKYLGQTGLTNTVAQSTTNAVNLLKDVSLYSLGGGGLPTTIWSATNGAALAEGSYFERSPLTISVTYRSGASFASPGLTLVFAPVWDGDNADMNNIWTVGFTTVSPSLTQLTTQSTNVPMSKFAGAKKMRLLRVWNADATPLDSDVFLQSVRLNGFVP